MKILILSDSLNVGGAETHIELLANEIYKMGHEVAVASTGGLIQSRLIQNKIKCYRLPKITQSSTLSNSITKLRQIFNQRKAILKIIKQFKPDVVHAHTRTTAFLANGICKFQKIPLITTCHALFSMKFPKNRLSKWGCRTIAVSQDIANHLVRHGVLRKAIDVIPNGVKLPLHNKYEHSKDDVYNNNAHKIVFVSRLDEDCSLGAHVLCSIAPILAQKYNNCQIFIVGGGTEYHKIKEKAQEINDKLNRELIIAVGQSENPSDFFKKASLFVGVSRAALEAMSCGMPVILLGNEGYLGLLSPENLKIAQDTNFTCRGTATTNGTTALKSLLLRDICKYFELSQEGKSSISNFSYQLVKKEYGAYDMANKTIGVYQKAINNYAKVHPTAKNRSLKISVCGYYGHKNLGDEAILSIIKQKLSFYFPNAKIYIISGKNPIKILRRLHKTDLFIFGGGSLLQNSTSNASLFYYLSIIHVANLLCKHKIMLANGIGPIQNHLISSKVLLKIIGKAINTFDYISVRDTNSQSILKAILPNRKIHLIPDPTLLCARDLLQTSNPLERKTYFVYIPCSNALQKNNITPYKLADSLSYIKNKFSTPITIAVLNPKKDLKLAKKLKGELESIKIVCPDTPIELCSILDNAKFVISQRYHGSLFALIKKTPALSISSDPKLRALCEDYRLFPCQHTDIIASPDKIIRKLVELKKEFEDNSYIRESSVEKSCVRVDNELKKLFQFFSNLY